MRKLSYVVCSGLITLFSCNLLQSSVGIDQSNLLGKGIEAGKDVWAAKGKAEEQCNPLGDINSITTGEEINIGGAIAAGLVMQGGLKVDLPVELRHLSVSDISSKLSRNAKYKTPETSNKWLTTAITLVGKGLIPFSTRKDLLKSQENEEDAFQFGVLKNDSVNAYSTPGGPILPTEGLVKMIQTEAELACVLAHEIGHIEQKHGLKEFAMMKRDQCILAITAETGGKIGGSFIKLDVNVPLANQFNFNSAKAEMITKLTDLFVEKFIGSGYARQSEFEADERMFDLVSQVGYDQNACLEFLKRLPDAKGAFAHHPSNKDRIAHLQQYAAKNKDSLGFGIKGERPPWTLESVTSHK